MVPKNLNQFLNEVKTKGIRKQNQFQVVITSGYADIDKTLENFTLWANNSKLPGRTVETAELLYQAYPFKLPTRMIMDQ